jgi:hypothetical protein
LWWEGHCYDLGVFVFWTAVNDLASGLPHYSHNAPMIGLTILAITAVAIAIALWRSSRHR